MIRRVLGPALLILVIATPAGADFIVDVSVTVTPDPIQGVYLYNYLLSNPMSNADDGDPDLIFDFILTVSTQAALTNIVAPANWTVTYTAGDPQIEWSAMDVPFAIAPGATLNLGFASLIGPGDTDYSALALNQGGTNVDIVIGRTRGPVGQPLVPEPTSLTLLAISMLALLGYSRCRHNRSRDET